MTEQKINNYRFDICVEEWAEGQGWQILNRRVKVEQHSLNEAIEKFTKIDEQFEV